MNINYHSQAADPEVAANDLAKSNLPLTVKTALAGLLAYLGPSGGDSVVVNAQGTLGPRGASLQLGARYSAPASPEMVRLDRS